MHVEHELNKLTLQALHLGVAGVANGAGAAGCVAPGLTDGVSAARVHVTRVPTRALHAFVRVPAVTVRGAGGRGGHYNGIRCAH